MLPSSVLKHKDSCLNFSLALNQSCYLAGLSLLPDDHQAGGHQPYQGQLHALRGRDVKQNYSLGCDILNLDTWINDYRRWRNTIMEKLKLWNRIECLDRYFFFYKTFRYWNLPQLFAVNLTHLINNSRNKKYKCSILPISVITIVSNIWTVNIYSIGLIFSTIWECEFFLQT